MTNRGPLHRRLLASSLPLLGAFLPASLPLLGAFLRSVLCGTSSFPPTTNRGPLHGLLLASSLTGAFLPALHSRFPLDFLRLVAHFSSLCVFLSRHLAFGVLLLSRRLALFGLFLISLRAFLCSCLALDAFFLPGLRAFLCSRLPLGAFFLPGL